MITPFLNRLVSRTILLASGSPRRQEILNQLGLPFKAVPSDFAEDLDLGSFSSYGDYVQETAKHKALDVAKNLETGEKDPPHLIIAADTVVVLEDNVIGKPKNPADAISILERLSGKTHFVYTGVALIVYHGKYENDPYNYQLRIFHERTEVKIAPLTSEIIKTYVETKEPLDKAGGYAIQGLGATFIEGIKGDYFNVVGFPVHRFCKEICDLCNGELL